MARIIYHKPHGEAVHDLAIFLTERLCEQRKYAFLNPTWLKAKGLYHGEPDVYVRVPHRNVESGGKVVHDFTDYIIEVETQPSSESIIKKFNQFEANNAKHELLIIDLWKYRRDGGDIENWQRLSDYIDWRLPT